MKKLFLLVILCVSHICALPKVSVIVPVYNTERYLTRCLESIINQSYKDIEIICVNDGSSDGSLGILRDYEKKDPRIIVIDQKNAGVSSARNAGLNKATGEFISFVDSDDYIHPEMIELSLNVLKQYDVDIIMFNATNSNPINTKTNFKKIDLKNIQIIQQDVYDSNFSINNLKYIFCWNKLYKRSTIKNIRFNNNVHLSEDFLFNFFVFNIAKKYVFLDARIYYYTGDNESLSRSIFTRAKVDYNKIILMETSKYNDFITIGRRDEFFSDIGYSILYYAFWTSFSFDVFLYACDVICDFYLKNEYRYCISQKSIIRQIFMQICFALGKVRKLLGLNNSISWETTGDLKKI